MNLLLTALSFSLAIIGLYVSFQWPGMILRPVKERLDTLLPRTLAKPLYDCPICMSSCWTIIFLTLLHIISAASPLRAEAPAVISPLLGRGVGVEVALLLLLIPAVAGINTFLCIALDKLTDYGC